MKFITWTTTSLHNTDDFCVMPPDVALKLARQLGFDTLEYSSLSPTEAESHMLEVNLLGGF